MCLCNIFFFISLIHTGQFLNGLAGPIAMGAPPALSAEWFPPEQRTSATALATISNVLGLAVSFLLGKHTFVSQNLLVTIIELLVLQLQKFIILTMILSNADLQIFVLVLWFCNSSHSSVCTAPMSV